jgi:hypothetical protein
VSDPDPADNHGTVQVSVGAPAPVPPTVPPVLTVVAGPSPGYVGGSVTVTYTVTNTGDRSVTGLSLAIKLPEKLTVSALPAACRTAAGCAVGNLEPGGSTVVQAVLTPTEAGRYRLGATVSATSHTEADSAVRAETVLTVRQPEITALPPVGSPGTVTLVRGTGFPPGVPVRLDWSPGITAAANPSKPGADGSFVAQMLILAGDRTGRRTVTATGSGFDPVSAPFLVTGARLLPPLRDVGTDDIADAGPDAGTQSGTEAGTQSGTDAGASGAPARPSAQGRKP